jgi:hypothetical protein
MDQTEKILEMEQKIIGLTQRLEKLEKKTEKTITHKVYGFPIEKAEKLSATKFADMLETHYQKDKTKEYCSKIIDDIYQNARKNLKEVIKFDMKSWSKGCQKFFIEVCEMMRIFEGDEQKKQLFNNN